MYMSSFMQIGSGIQKLIGRIHIQTHRLMGGIYEVRHCEGLGYHDIHTNVIKIGLGIQTLMGGGYTDMMVIAYAYFYFIKIRKVG
jgi:hypothetical protein